MTLPVDIILPLRPEQIKSADPNQLELYMRDLVNSLTDMYQNIVQNVNGTIRQFTPIVKGGTSEGTGTYTSQVGWYLRQGIIVDVWFDVIWTAHTGTGIAYVQLPYKVGNSATNPFAGTLATATLTLSAGYTSTFCVAIPNTFRCNAIQYGSGVPMLNITVPAAGRFSGHVRYFGQEFEN